ncbi:MAG: hypothetical protein HQM14_15060 [SAR324 cluster bacterium]|nr:hypothetical protein [SAR324 cluster bacterium]
MLWQIASAKKNIDWHFFETEFEKQFAIRPNMNELVQEPSEKNFIRFCELYTVGEPVTFAQFQAKFNLIIAIMELSNLSEVTDVVQQVCHTHFQQGLQHAEYRMLFPPWIEESLMSQLLHTICEQLHSFEQKTNHRFQGRLSCGLPRTDHGTIHYELLRHAMSTFPVVAQMITSVDFCFIEEGFPPKNQRSLFQRILNDNQKKPQQALAILYHVGESFEDKSLESAIRWVHESAEIGAHRLGHAIALGSPPQHYLGKTYSESVEERLDQIAYDLSHKDGLQAAGVQIHAEMLLTEQRQLQEKKRAEKTQKTYDSFQLDQILLRQNYVMQYLRDHNVCIESCPTSNLCIGRIESIEHPLHRFIEANLPVVIASDDPGIFDTTLQQEAEWVAQHITGSEDTLHALAQNAKKFRSEIISGRCA